MISLLLSNESSPLGFLRYTQVLCITWLVSPRRIWNWNTLNLGFVFGALAFLPRGVSVASFEFEEGSSSEVLAILLGISLNLSSSDNLRCFKCLRTWGASACLRSSASELEVLLEVLFFDVDPSEGLHGKMSNTQKEHS